MVIDTSAILAMLFDEPEADEFERLVEADSVVLVSAVSRVEAAFVVEGRKGDAGRIRLNRFFELVRAEVVPVGADQAEVACETFRHYGKDRHPANLNFGDVFAYALAKTTGEPLLFKGDDFRLTDLSSLPGEGKEPASTRLRRWRTREKGRDEDGAPVQPRLKSRAASSAA